MSSLNDEQRNLLEGGVRVPYVTFRFHPGAEFSLEDVSVDISSAGTYVGGTYSNGDPIIDPYKAAFMMNIGSLGELQKLSHDEKEFIKAYTFLFTEFNEIIKLKAQEQISKEQSIVEGNSQ